MTLEMPWNVLPSLETLETLEALDALEMIGSKTQPNWAAFYQTNPQKQGALEPVSNAPLIWRKLGLVSDWRLREMQRAELSFWSVKTFLANVALQSKFLFWAVVRKLTVACLASQKAQSALSGFKVWIECHRWPLNTATKNMQRLAHKQMWVLSLFRWSSASLLVVVTNKMQTNSEQFDCVGSAGTHGPSVLFSPVTMMLARQKTMSSMLMQSAVKDDSLLLNCMKMMTNGHCIVSFRANMAVIQSRPCASNLWV